MSPFKRFLLPVDTIPADLGRTVKAPAAVAVPPMVYFLREGI